MKKWLIIVFLIVCASVWGNTYYIDFTAPNDAANGTSKTTPWKHHPYMQGWSGSYSHVAGDSFIFKGGVEWDSSCFTIEIAANGSLAKRDYYGIDSAWYEGSTFRRPVFDFHWKTPQTPRCTAVHGNYAADLIFDGFEMRNILCTVNAGTGFFLLSDSKRILIRNCYLHGWKLIPGITVDNAHGGIYTVSACSTIVVDNCEISNKEAMDIDSLNGLAVQGCDTVKYCKIHDVPSVFLGNRNAHHNEIYNVEYPHRNFDPTYHTNLWYGIYSGSFHHNYIHHIGQVGEGIYPNPANGGSGGCGNGVIYIYDNVYLSDSIPRAQYMLDINFNFTGSGKCGEIYVWNNIFQSKNPSSSTIRVINAEATDTLKKLVFQNNLLIFPTASVAGDSIWGWYNAADKGNVAEVINNHNILMTPSTAEANGMLRADLYRPTPACTTINRGADLSGYFTTDFLDKARPPAGSWDIGAYEYVVGMAVAPSVFNRQTLPYAAIYLRGSCFIVALPASVRSPELTIFDLAGREVYRATLNKTDESVYNCAWRKAPAAGAYFAMVRETSRNDGAVLARTKFVVGR